LIESQALMHLDLSFQRLHGKTPSLFIMSDSVLCFGDKQRVTDYCDTYFSKLFTTVAGHCEFLRRCFSLLSAGSRPKMPLVPNRAGAAGGEAHGIATFWSFRFVMNVLPLALQSSIPS
jgi:hypothetical protein